MKESLLWIVLLAYMVGLAFIATGCTGMAPGTYSVVSPYGSGNFTTPPQHPVVGYEK